MFDLIECSDNEDMEQMLEFYTTVLLWDVVKRIHGRIHLRRGDEEFILVPPGTIVGISTDNADEAPIFTSELPVHDLERARAHFRKHNVRFLPGHEEKIDRFTIMDPHDQRYEVFQDDLGIVFPQNLNLTIFVRVGDYSTATVSSWREEVLSALLTECEKDQSYAAAWHSVYDNILAYGTHSIRTRSDLTIGGLIASIRRKHKLTGEYFVSIIESRSDKSLWSVNDSVETTLEDLNITDHTGLIVLFTHETANRYSLQHHTSAPGLLSHIVTNLSEVNQSRDDNQITGILLYTNSDIDLALYVRTNFTELHHMSGRNIHIHVLESPTSRIQKAIEHWSDVFKNIDKKIMHVFELLKWLSTRPCDKSEVYAIAKSLGIYPDQIPCLVLFPRIPGGPLIGLPVEGSTEGMRRLFGYLNRCLDDNADPSSRLKDIDPSILFGVLNSEAEQTQHPIPFYARPKSVLKMDREFNELKK